jgi:AAA ATPase domain
VVGVRCPVFVGRDAELGALRAHLAAALDGRGGFAMVRGAAGLGKSRLCRELIDGAAERGLAIADDAGLGVWRLRALHELATIELLDEAGTGRLLEARRSAEALGALSTAATLGLQLAAASHLRFELDEGARYARDALGLGERLGLDRVRVMALWFLAENHALRRERGESERLLALTQAAAPGDAEVDGMVWAGARAMTALLDDDRPAAAAQDRVRVAHAARRDGT